MTDVWLTSDHHFGHANILKFTDDKGVHLRNFNSIYEMNMMLIENWNAVVKPHDKVYHLGDFCFDKSLKPYLKLLHGDKRLVKGNHDKFQLPFYREIFKDIHGIKFLHNYILSHIPIHPNSIDGRRAKRFNVHGHLHRGYVLDKRLKRDKRYINVCVENTNYTPVHIDELERL